MRAPRQVAAGSEVTLDASGSTDPEGQPLTFAWEQIEGSEVDLAGDGTAIVTFRAPDAAGSVRFSVVAFDGVMTSEPREVAVTVIADNAPPVATVGPSVTVDERAIAALMERAEREPSLPFTLDLPNHRITAGDLAFTVAIPHGTRQQLMEGRWDTAAELLEDTEAIKAVAAKLPYFGGWA